MSREDLCSGGEEGRRGGGGEMVGGFRSMTGEKQAGYCSVWTRLLLAWRKLEQEFEKERLL